MNRLLLFLSFLLYASSIHAQYLHTSPSGTFGNGISSGSYYRADTIRISGADYVEFDVSVMAADYGFSQVMIYSHDFQTQYYSISVAPGQLGTEASDQHYYYIPNNCLTLINLSGLASATVSYREYEQPSLIQYAYDNAGNRVGREIVYLQTYMKGLMKEDQEVVEEIENEIEENREFKVYPNPTTQSVFIALNDEAIEAEEKRIVVYDNLGRQIINQEAFSEIERIDLSAFESGFYVVKLIYGPESKECIVIKK